jgi:uncharacterized protein (TIGR03086 family)
MSDISTRFAKVAAGFTARVQAVPDQAWEQPVPCAGWVARDVVRHLVEWLPGPGFLLGAFDVATGPIPSVDHDPAAAWRVVRDAIQQALEDPAVAGRVADCGPPGTMSLEAAVDMTCIPDVLIHTWDLARATGQDDTLDADEVHHLWVGLESMPPEVEAGMRASGHYGPRTPVDPGADEQTRLIAFTGRPLS